MLDIYHLYKPPAFIFFFNNHLTHLMLIVLKAIFSYQQRRKQQRYVEYNHFYYLSRYIYIRSCISWDMEQKK